MICLDHICLVAGAALELGARENRALSHRDLVVAEGIGAGEQRNTVELHGGSCCEDEW